MNITSRSSTLRLFLPLFLIFFAIPYLFDLVFYEELYATQLPQAALIDAEKLESDGKYCAGFDGVTTGNTAVLPAGPSFISHCSLKGCGSKASISALLTSRPPPTS